MSKQALELWTFNLVAPDHPDGMVAFNFAIETSVAEALRNNAGSVWSVLLHHVEMTRLQEISNAQ